MYIYIYLSYVLHERYNIDSAVFWCSLAWLKQLSKAKPSQAKPHQIRATPKKKSPSALALQFFFSLVQFGGRTKPSQPQAEPHRRKAGPFRPGSAVVCFSSVRLGSPSLVYIYIHTYMCMHTYIYKYIHTHIYICIYTLYVHVYIYICVHIHIHIHIHIHRIYTYRALYIYLYGRTPSWGPLRFSLCHLTRL